MIHFTERDYQTWVAKGLVSEPRQLQAAAPRHPWANKSKAGFRADLGHFCRSRWEANLARFYRFTGVAYFYEPVEFWFPVDRGIRTYKPDFWLPEEDKWVEVKGYMDRTSKTKLNRFRRYYPAERLEVITGAFFQELKRQGVDRLIEGWE